MVLDAALHSGSKCYFFDGSRIIRVTRGDSGPGKVDAGYPADITVRGWPRGAANLPPGSARSVLAELRSDTDAGVRKLAARSAPGDSGPTPVPER